jgi:hypothetical protein
VQDRPTQPWAGLCGGDKVGAERGTSVTSRVVAEYDGGHGRCDALPHHNETVITDGGNGGRSAPFLMESGGGAWGECGQVGRRDGAGVT